jgi:hypothetical protein
MHRQAPRADGAADLGRRELTGPSAAAPGRIRNLLVVYSLVQYPPRQTVRDAIEAFGNYSGARCFYLNLAVQKPRRWLMRVPFDAVVFHTTFLSERWNPPSFQRVLDRARPLAETGGRRVALPQDESLRSEDIEAFAESFGVDHIFSVGPPSTWSQLYPRLEDRVGLSRVMTGYLDPRTLARIEGIVSSTDERPIDIGYRALNVPPWLGRHASLKLRIAEAVREAALARGMRVDISTRDSDTLRGDDWYRFLASCKYTIGVEGGASVHDADGSVKDCSDHYVAANPGATFDQVEAACFPGRDGEIDYRAISPRHLEACATRTCQVLVEGDYNGVLEPGTHYIPLREDLSNLDEVLDAVQADVERQRIVDAAYEHVVASGEYTYERLVEEVRSVAFAEPAVAADSRGVRLTHRLSRVAERLSWAKVAAYVLVARRLRALALRVLPEAVLSRIRRRVAGSAAEAAAMQSAD